MARKKPQRDLLNEQIIGARNLAAMQVFAFRNMTPNPVGETDSDRIPTKMTMTELNRLLGKE